MQLTKKVDVTVDVDEDGVTCGNCRFAYDATPNCVLYGVWVTWDMIRCEQCLKDFGRGK